MDVLQIIPAVKHYQWGSPDLIPSFLHMSNEQRLPVAELWFGSHPAGMSMMRTASGIRPLGELIAEDPEGWTGKAVKELPFLMKVLGIQEPLSLQCHPDLSQARRGFERESHLPWDSPLRNYRDGNHKPEIICALTEFQAMCGFRNLEDIHRLAEGIKLFELMKARSCREVFLHTLGMKTSELEEAAQRAESRKDDPPYSVVGRLHEIHGADPGILAPLYLQLFTLAPGEALFLGPGVLHAYLEGMGLEVMASSDNVIRGGLTAKHVDRRELDQTAVFSHTGSPGVVPEEEAPGVTAYPVPVDDFQLKSFSRGTFSLGKEDSLHIGISTEGTFRITWGSGQKISGRAGDAFCIPAALSEVLLNTDGMVYIASGGQPA